MLISTAFDFDYWKMSRRRESQSEEGSQKSSRIGAWATATRFLLLDPRLQVHVYKFLFSVGELKSQKYWNHSNICSIFQAFHPPEKFIWFNYNSHAFHGKKTDTDLQNCLINSEKLAVITDPPFGSKTELICQELNQSSKWNKQPPSYLWSWFIMVWYPGHLTK